MAELEIENFTPPREKRLPEKGSTTGTIIGIIIGVILVFALIGTAIAMYRKHKNKLNGDGPPNYKPPPPKKHTNNATNGASRIYTPVASASNVQTQNYSTQSAEPVTDLDAYHDDEDREHYYSAAPSGWDDPGNNEVPPPYMHTNSDPQDDYQGPNINRGDSFVSPAMFV